MYVIFLILQIKKFQTVIESIWSLSVTPGMSVVLFRYVSDS